MSRPDVEGIAARARAATPGPWVATDHRMVETEEPPGDGSYEGDCADVCEVLHYGSGPGPGPMGTAEFIAAARTDVPHLCAYIRELEAALQALRAPRTRGE